MTITHAPRRVVESRRVDRRSPFEGRIIDCKHVPRDVVVTTDWGKDDAVNNVLHAIADIAGTFARQKPDIIAIDGVPAFGDPIIGAAVLNRFLDTHQASQEFKLKIGARNGLKGIGKKLRGLVCLEVYDRLVGDGERVIAAAEGWLRFGGGASGVPEYRVPVNVLGVPDNGILGSVVRRLENVRMYRIENPDLKLNDFGCKTWDGRTAFAPAAALLASGAVDISEFGRELDIAKYPWINIFKPAQNGHGIEVGAIFIDKFGNVKLGIGSDAINKLGQKVAIHSTRRDGGEILAAVGEKFADVKKGEFVVYPGSNRLLEIAINQGNAAEALGLTREDISIIRVGDEIRPKATLTISSQNGVRHDHQIATCQ